MKRFDTSRKIKAVIFQLRRVTPLEPEQKIRLLDSDKKNLFDIYGNALFVRR